MSLRYRGTLQVTTGFWLLAAWFAVVNGWQLLLTVLGAAAAHEAGHWLVLRLLGAEILGLRIGVLGMVLETDSRTLSYGGELASVLAGPGANLLCACLLMLSGGGWDTAIGAHLVLGLFNLLPVRPLDGGRALHLLSAWLLGPARGDQITRWVGTAVAGVLSVGICCLMWRTGGSLWLVPAAAGMMAAAGQECFGKSDFL